MPKYELITSSSFKKDYKTLVKRKKKIELLDEVVEMLLDGKILPEKYKDHQLSGNWKNYRECHIEPDWLLVYRLYENTLVLALTRTGTHSDLNF